jgi:hypothetical protein
MGACECVGILINASNITALEQTGAGNRARVDGGGGIDTLKLDGAGLTLDLTVQLWHQYWHHYEYRHHK